MENIKLLGEMKLFYLDQDVRHKAGTRNIMTCTPKGYNSVYLTCPFCPAAALQSLRTPSKFPACGIVIFTCISGHKFYVDEESLNGKGQVDQNDMAHRPDNDHGGA